jgi:hypothetical protein
VEAADLNDAVGAYRLLEGVLARMDALPPFSFLP